MRSFRSPRTEQPRAEARPATTELEARFCVSVPSPLRLAIDTHARSGQALRLAIDTPARSGQAEPPSPGSRAPDSRLSHQRPRQARRSAAALDADLLALVLEDLDTGALEGGACLRV